MSLRELFLIQGPEASLEVLKHARTQADIENDEIELNLAQVVLSQAFVGPTYHISKYL